MTIEEANELINNLRKNNYEDDKIIYSFMMMFLDDKLNANQLNALVNLMNFHLSEDFLNMSNKKQKKAIRNAYNIK